MMILFFLSIILILITYIINLKHEINLIKSLNNTKSSNKDEKDEYLKMCYKSRILYYMKSRHIKLNTKNNELITIQQKINYFFIFIRYIYQFMNLLTINQQL